MTVPDSQLPGQSPRRAGRLGVFAVAGAAALVGVAVFAAISGASSAPARPAAAAKGKFLEICIQTTGAPQSKGDLNAILKNRNCHHKAPTKLALYPVHSTQGPAGPPGPQGPAGPAGPTGPFVGAFYSVENYTGTLSAGAIATAACDPNDAANSQKYVAISGGFQETAKGTPLQPPAPLPLSSSFPGRMDWSTFTPIPGRLDGWIIKLGNPYHPGSGAKVVNPRVWALCIPEGLVEHDDSVDVPTRTKKHGP